MIARLKRIEPVRRLGLVLLIASAVVILIGASDAHRGESLARLLEHTFVDLYANIGTELASIAITVLIIDRLYKRRAMEERKHALVLQMGSPDHAFAIEAVRILTARGWLDGGLLKGVHLTLANLEGVHLLNVNLQEAHLELANLRKARFTGADMQRAYLQGANLDGANLCGVNLCGANLNDANLSGAHLDDETIFDVETILPDCTYWQPGTEMSRFTDPKHPHFWRSHNPNSPACIAVNGR